MSYPIYRESPSNDLLSQGDILDPASLRKTLEGHQDYFVNRPYFRRYIILTQTCDLDRTREPAEFICLAVVRKLSDIFGMRQVDGEKAQNRTLELLRQLYNHNSNKRGLFYLPENANYGIEEDSVADIRVMFSVHKASYEDLLRARCGAITDLYAAQLGHITGYMFSRVATPGWNELNPGLDLDNHAKNIRKSIRDREQERFLELKKVESACSYCTTPASTYRWVPVEEEEKNQWRYEEHLLCKDHMKMYEEHRAGNDNDWPRQRPRARPAKPTA